MSMHSEASYTLVAHAVEAMLDKKARDITVMDMRDVAGFVDYFVVGTGDSELQIKAVAEEIRTRVRTQCGEKPWHMEGADAWQWVLLDYVDVVTHVFSPEKRAFYDLERLWGDAPRKHVGPTGLLHESGLRTSGSAG